MLRLLRMQRVHAEPRRRSTPPPYLRPKLDSFPVPGWATSSATTSLNAREAAQARSEEALAALSLRGICGALAAIVRLVERRPPPASTARMAPAAGVASASPVKYERIAKESSVSSTCAGINQ